MTCIGSSHRSSVLLDEPCQVGYQKQRASSVCFSRRERHLVVPEGIPSQIVVQAYCTTSVFDLCDLTRFCFYYMLFSPSVPLSKSNVVRALFHLWWCASGA